MSGFTPEQIEMLLRPIKPRRVMQAQGQSHVPAYDIVAHLNRLFGFGGWDKRIVAIDCVEERNDVPNKSGWYVTYRCLMELIIRDPEGNIVTIKQDGACGSAQNQPILGDAHDFAYKNSISYALKRCAKDLGDQFGLSLYNKGAIGPLVGTTLVGRSNDQTQQGADLQDHAPVPESLGNDERQVDPDTGEILSDTPPAASEVSGPGEAERKEDNPPSSNPAEKNDQTGTGVVHQPPPVEHPMLPTTMRRLFATLKGVGIGEDTRHEWAAEQLDRPVPSFTELSEADGQTLVKAAAKVKVNA